MDGEEISRLIDTATITAILRRDCPTDRLIVRKSKLVSMRYHWIRDLVRLDEFSIQRRPGNLNYADFFTKHLPVPLQFYLLTTFTVQIFVERVC